MTREGKRRWICPKVSEGRLLNARRIVAYILLAIFTLVPYMKVGGKPMILLDLATRRFTFFGVTFLPTDTVLLALLLVTVFVSIFLITSLFGRVWCGWACPQTVYMEFVFRPIERLLTGKPGATKKNWLVSSGFGRLLKPVVFLLVAMYLAHTFLAYFVGVEQLAVWVRRSPFEHPGSFLVMLAVTGLMLFDFGYFREQTCIVACPYGRFQSVLLDRDSVIVAYDSKRGEPRGKRRASPRKSATRDVALPVLAISGVGTGEQAASTPEVGDCVDCKLCVTTCPTGIDIRNGLQMECINCAQCIDACDAVMTKLDRPTGLIRYSSQRALEEGTRRVVRPRTLIYSLLIVLLISLFGYALSTRSTATVIVVRGRGAPFSQMPDGEITNRMSIKITNRTAVTTNYALRIEGISGALIRHEESLEAGPESSINVPITIAAPFNAFERGRVEGALIVEDDTGRYRRRVRLLLMGPGSLANNPTMSVPALSPEGDAPDEPAQSQGEPR
ncbi:cytochrome c oxidase accessory protein CcoG [Nodularia spumigena]|uniref:cytochrome c oxidase accessory protein CcoG n=1 Tax=Nodularia spumigena TaxID=70799 RepID=UPI002B1F3CE4|nr:cytochrome c oxidase accessory protein CcoG [Nodularia spumigena]MEA5556247.1 cytochrome c oxidase accessory protein CcoG [Nodularia spumigena CH309]